MTQPILFDRLSASGYSIHTIDPLTGTEKWIGEGRFPHWSPDAERIVFSEVAGVSASICIMNADGTDVRQLTESHLDINASWHPDGRSVLFNRVWPEDSRGERRAAIMRVRIADGTADLYTDHVTGWYASAVWRPDGSAVAVASNAFGPRMEVCLFDPAGQLIRRVTHTPDGVSGTHLDWSPDGDRILFGAFRDGAADTYVIDCQGGSPVRLTGDPERIQSGAKWSPDGNSIVLHVTPVGDFDQVIHESELHVMDANGSNMRQLTSSPHSNAHPDW